MSRLNYVNDLSLLRENLQEKIRAEQEDKIIITIGMGTCGLAAGAGETFRKIQNELTNRNIIATVRSVGCIGMCVKEPLVDIQLPGQPRITYTNVVPSHVPRLIEEHILKGLVVYEWAIGFVPPEW